MHDLNMETDPDNKPKSNKEGSVLKWIVIGVLLVVFTVSVVIVVFLFVNSKNTTTTEEVDKTASEHSLDNSDSQQVNETVPENIKEGMDLSHNSCEGDEKTKLGTLPMNETDFSAILPYGLTVGGHVTPIDHQYFSPADFSSKRDAYPVYAMADANIVDIGPRETDGGTEYRLVFSISCTLFYYYDLVTSLTPEIEAAWKKQENGIVYPVKEGEQIGYIGGQTLDFAVWDTDVNLTGFIVPEHYKGESWKIHTVDPLNYYTDELKAKVLAKYMRTIEPVSGKIDYDVDGKLIGNWFIEGTGGYIGGSLEGYWKTHLSIAPDAYDPTSIVVSIGDFGGKALQFGVKGNSPDPAKIGVKDELVKYELVQQDWADANGNHWDRTSLVKGLKAQNQTTVQGVALFQLTGTRTLKAEFFPGKTASQVTGFTANAKMYER